MSDETTTSDHPHRVRAHDPAVGRGSAATAASAAVALAAAAVAVFTGQRVPSYSGPISADDPGAGPVLAPTAPPTETFFDLLWPPLLVAGGVVLACAVGYRVVWTGGAKRAAGGAGVLAIAAGVLHLLAVAGREWGPDRASWWATTTDGVQFAASALLAASLPVAVALVLVIAARAFAYRRARRPQLSADDVVGPPRTGCTGMPPSTFWRYVTRRDVHPAAHDAADGKAGSAVPAAARWQDAYAVPGLSSADKARLGICVSGGGVRSASVTLGALQSLRARGLLQRARWLVSVSGGGYTAGAFRLALQPHPREDGQREPAVGPDDVFAPGSAEEDHVRRHSSYVADGAPEWFAAAAVVLRGVVASLLLVTLTLVGAALAVGAFYRFTDVADLSSLTPRAAAPRGACSDGGVACHGYPTPADGVLAAVLAAVLLAAALYLTAVVTYSWSGRPARALLGGARSLLQVALVLAVVGLAVPALVWASVRTTWALGPDNGPGAVPTGAAGAAGTVLLTYFATLLAVLWRGRKVIGRRLRSLRNAVAGRAAPAKQAVAGGPTQRLVVAAALAVLALLFLFLFGGVVHAAAVLWSGTALAYVALGVAIGAGVAAMLDQTWLGLHPFYRQRLASAFAVRRAAGGSGPVAVPYDYDTETTSLSEYARYDPDGRFPQVVFAAAANLSGQEHAPPGRRAVSFTLSGDYVGGPDVGWVRTAALESVTAPHVQRDLTVQAAVAISGAAFASAMGRHARAAQTLLALSNARLGSWLPNPAFVDEWRRRGHSSWTFPGIPRVRRLSYLFREIVGSYPCNDRLLLITDGGHYENLGLVELLRRCPRQVICIDASGDSPPLATTLADALRLAREELGIEFRLDDALHLVPGSADPLAPDEVLAVLNTRLSRAGVVTGRFDYPPESGLSEDLRRDCQIVVAKSSLVQDMPYDLLAYAAQSQVFPRDSTADQWFDSGQFENYLQLGRWLGRRAAAALESLEAEDAERAAATRRRRAQPAGGTTTPPSPRQSERMPGGRMDAASGSRSREQGSRLPGRQRSAN